MNATLELLRHKTLVLFVTPSVLQRVSFWDSNFFPTMSFTLGIRPFEMDKPIKNAYIPKTKKHYDDVFWCKMANCMAKQVARCYTPHNYMLRAPILHTSSTQ